ncbi:MAG: hypothetical protein AABY18_01440 [Candidatus Thermoplasmatota archaeon]
MRRRAWIAWGCLVVGIVFGILGRVLPGTDTWNLLAGILFLTAIVLGLSLLPVARKVVPGLVDFPDLFDRPRPNERWCASCGHPTGAKGPCRSCGATPASSGR